MVPRGLLPWMAPWAFRHADRYSEGTLIPREAASLLGVHGRLVASSHGPNPFNSSESSLFDGWWRKTGPRPGGTDLTSKVWDVTSDRTLAAEDLGSRSTTSVGIRRQLPHQRRLWSAELVSGQTISLSPLKFPYFHLPDSTWPISTKAHSSPPWLLTPLKWRKAWLQIYVTSRSVGKIRLRVLDNLVYYFLWQVHGLVSHYPTSRKKSSGWQLAGCPGTSGPIPLFFCKQVTLITLTFLGHQLDANGSPILLSSLPFWTQVSALNFQDAWWPAPPNHSLHWVLLSTSQELFRTLRKNQMIPLGARRQSKVWELQLLPVIIFQCKNSNDKCLINKLEISSHK